MADFTIAIALWDGVEELDFAGPYEVLTAWARARANVRSPCGPLPSATEPITCAHGLRVLPDVSWDDVGAFDLLVLPGGDTRPLQADESFLERMRTLARVRGR